jgi:hypothetical protein
MVDVNAITHAAEMFARQASASVNLHEGTHHELLPQHIIDQLTATKNSRPMSADSSSSSPPSPTWKPIELALSGGQKGSPVFVPSGSAGNDKYNAFASVSKAVRAAKTWNQQIAAQIKSLQNGGLDYLIQGPTSFHEMDKEKRRRN